jgi:hypothetical protein
MLRDRTRKLVLWIAPAIAAGALASPAAAGAQTLDVSNARVIEGDSSAKAAQFTITLSAPQSSDVYVYFSTHELTATDPEDYVGTAHRVRFAPGVTRRQVAVAVQPDIADEGLEKFAAKLAHPQGATLGNSRGVGRIVDNDEVLNETDSGAEADYCALAYPSTITMSAGDTSPLIYGQINEAGVTEATGSSSRVYAQLGYGPSGTDPTTQPEGWIFYPAGYNDQLGNADEYAQNLTVLTPRLYSYTYRFSIDGGFGWTYCDLDGAGSAPTLSFDPEQLGSMTVTGF